MKIENHFSFENAVEKPLTCNRRSELIRFFEYPWSSKDWDYKYEISRVEQGQTYKPLYVRVTRLAVNH